MKILILITKHQGGVGRANRAIKKHLELTGHTVDILSREDDLKIKSFFKSLFYLRAAVNKLVKEESYDIIYSQDWSMALPLIFPYRIHSKKHFCCFCGHQENWLRFLQVYVSKKMKNKLVVIGPLLKGEYPNAKLIPRGVDEKEFIPLKKERKYLGMVGKDSEILTENQLKKVSKKVGMPPLIAKNILPKDMNKFYNKCKVFISLPPMAGFNLSWAEAMSSGVPIVIGNYQGAGQMFPFNKIKNEEISVDNIVALINKADKKDYRKWLIDNGYTWKDVSKKLQSFFLSRKK